MRSERACFRHIVYVEWASRVNFVTIFGDLYQNKLWVICNNLNQFANLSSASGPSNDVIKMAAIVLLMYTYDIVIKAIVEGEFIARNGFSSLFNWLDVKQYEKDVFHFFRRLESIWGSQIDKFAPESITFAVTL